MREDFFENIEKMFPNGFLIVYPVDSGKAVNMKTHCPLDNKANRLMWNMYNMIKEESDSGSERTT